MCALSLNGSCLSVRKRGREIANADLVRRGVRSVLGARRDVFILVFRSVIRRSVGAKMRVLCDDGVSQLCARGWG